MLPTMLWTVWLGAEYLAELGSNDANNIVDCVVGADHRWMLLLYSPVHEPLQKSKIIDVQCKKKLDERSF